MSDFFAFNSKFDRINFQTKPNIYFLNNEIDIDKHLDKDMRKEIEILALAENKDVRMLYCYKQSNRKRFYFVRENESKTN